MSSSRCLQEDFLQTSLKDISENKKMLRWRLLIRLHQDKRLEGTIFSKSLIWEVLCRFLRGSCLACWCFWKSCAKKLHKFHKKLSAMESLLVNLRFLNFPKRHSSAYAFPWVCGILWEQLLKHNIINICWTFFGICKDSSETGNCQIFKFSLCGKLIKYLKGHYISLDFEMPSILK